MEEDLWEKAIEINNTSKGREYFVLCPQCDGIIKRSNSLEGLIGVYHCKGCNEMAFKAIKPKVVKENPEEPTEFAPEPKEKKRRKSKSIPKGILQTRRIHEVICPECREIARDSTGSRRELQGEYICEGCDTKFEIMEPSTKEDGRGKRFDKEVARNNILREIRMRGPISAQELGKRVYLCKVTTKKTLDDLEEEGLIEHVSKGWILVK